jgi:hypothetical protein
VNVGVCCGGGGETTVGVDCVGTSCGVGAVGEGCCCVVVVVFVVGVGGATVGGDVTTGGGGDDAITGAGDDEVVGLDVCEAGYKKNDRKKKVQK